MSKTHYADYGLKQSNIDRATGIRYGVISQNSLNHDALQDIFDQGKNLDFENWQDAVKEKLRGALKDYFGNYAHLGKRSRLDQAVDHAFDTLEDHGLNDCYEENCDKYRYDKDGITIETSDSDLFVTRSPFFTYAQFCSPCAPGACHLSNPLDMTEGEHKAGFHANNKCYCLGHDWFDDERAPYPVYLVTTGELIPPWKQPKVGDK